MERYQSCLQIEHAQAAVQRSVSAKENVVQMQEACGEATKHWLQGSWQSAFQSWIDYTIRVRKRPEDAQSPGTSAEEDNTVRHASSQPYIVFMQSHSAAWGCHAAMPAC
jgi:hypothetical protein